MQKDDYDKTCALVVHFDFLDLPLSIVTVNGFVPLHLDVKATFLYGELKEIINMHLPEGYRDGNTVTHLNRFRPSAT
jgi:hypothetical protein